LADLIAAGTRILESACGPCIGMGQAPRSGAVTVRTFNRNFKGRCGTKDAGAYLVSPETAAWIAIKGEFVDPTEFDGFPEIEEAEPIIDDSMIIKPPETGNSGPETEIVRGPNIKPLPELRAVEDSLKKEVLLKVGDDITTDHIMPAGAQILPLRSNIPAISEYVFTQVDPEFSKRAKEKDGGIIVGGENYGQGSSREHAAIAPLYLGVRAVIAKSWARIHKKNLVNWGIVPLTFSDLADYGKIEQGEVVELPGLKEELKDGKEITVKTSKGEFKVKADLGPKATEVLLEGGLINYTKNKQG
jgi:aconitate hydratase